MGGGVVTAVQELKNGDYLLLVVNFEEHWIERLTASDWNDYHDSLQVQLDFRVHSEGGERHGTAR